MNFKIVLFVAAVFAYEANAQLGGMVRPFATGFASGLSDVSKPMVPFGQPGMPPVGDYVPRVPPMMPYPGQFPPRPQGVYDRFESFGPGMAGPGFFQGMVPPPMGGFKPQAQFYQIQGQFVKPPRPYPIPPALGEAVDNYGQPSSLLIQPPAEVPKPETPATLEAALKPVEPATLDAEFDIPTMQRPLPVEESKQ